MASLVAALREARGADGEPLIGSRRHMLKTHVNVFTGADAVGWAVQAGKAADRAAAVKLLQTLVDAEVLHHVADEHEFEDAPLFYRLLADEAESVRAGRAESALARIRAGVSAHGALAIKGGMFSGWPMVRTGRVRRSTTASTLLTVPPYLAEVLRAAGEPPVRVRAPYCGFAHESNRAGRYVALLSAGLPALGY